MKRKMILRYAKKSFNETQLSVLMKKNDIFYENYCLTIIDISAPQNFKQSEVKHFTKIIDFGIFQYLKITLRFI